jgi:hypothetical protein
MRDLQYSKFLEIIEHRNEYPIEKEDKKDKHHLILRRKEGGVYPGSHADLLVFERSDLGVTPD